MNKEKKPQSMPAPTPAEAFRNILAIPATGQALTILFGLLFLFQCMILPLVGKAAIHGSGSPGAGPMPGVDGNRSFFLAMLLATLAAGGLAFYAKWLRRRADGSPFPKATAGLLVLTGLLLLAFATGLLGI